MRDANLLSLLMVFVLQCLGAFEHFRFMRSTGRVSGNFYSYLVSAYPGRSTATYLVLAASAWASVEAGIGDNVNPELLIALIGTGHVPMASFVAIGVSLATGYGVDSRLNRGEQVAKL